MWYSTVKALQIEYILSKGHKEVWIVIQGWNHSVYRFSKGGGTGSLLS